MVAERGAQVRHPRRDAPHVPGLLRRESTSTAHLAATQRLGYARTVTDNAAMSYEDVIGGVRRPLAS